MPRISAFILSAAASSDNVKTKECNSDIRGALFFCERAIVALYFTPVLKSDKARILVVIEYGGGE